MTEESKKHITLVVVLAVLTFAVFYRILGHSLLLNWDDYDYVINNEMIRGLTWAHIQRAFAQSYFFNYSPLHMISYMVDYTMFGGIRPGGFFLINLLLHTSNGLLLYFLVFRLSGKKTLSFAASFIFLLHPVQVESVAWLSQRKNVLSMLFFLLSFLSYVRCKEKGSAGRRAFFYGCSVLAFILALLAKSAAIVLPVILVLYDLCYLARGGRGRWLLDKIPYLAASALMAVATVKSQSSLVQAGTETFHAGGPLETFYTMLTVLARYLGVLFWPTQLSVMYMPPVRFRIDSAVVWSAVLLVLLVTVGFVLYRRDRKLLFWYAISFVGLIPVSHIFPLPTLMNDRYLYYPLVGASVCLAAFVNFVPSASAVRYRKAAAVAIGATLCALPLLSWQRVSVWRDDTTLWRDVTLKEPRMPLAWASLGMSLYDAGRREEALKAYLQALAVDPNYQLALNNIGGLYNELGEREKARHYLIRQVQLFPEDFKGYMNLGDNYQRSGEPQKAEAMFLKALVLNPGLPNALYALGNLYLGMGRLDLARINLERAAAAVGADPDIEYNLARVESLDGEPVKALRYLRSSLANGFAKMDQLRTDRALDSLRSYPEFKMMLQQR